MISTEPDVRSPATDTCPVCQCPVGSPDVCQTCGWQLRGGYRLGRVTDAQEQAFGARLASARRRFDLVAAVRAAGSPHRLDPGRLHRLERFVRDAPVTDVERQELRRAVAEPSDHAGQIPVDAAVVEIDADGVVAPDFRADSRGVPRERARTTRWDWAAIVPGLSDDTDERDFQVAGGVGARPLDPVALDAALARELPPRLPAMPGPLVLVCRTPGWLVPEAAVRLLARRHPEALVLHVAGRRGATTIDCAGGLTAFAGDAPGAATIADPTAAGFTAADFTAADFTAAGVELGGVLVAGGDAAGSVRLWSMGSGHALGQAPGAGRSRITALAFSDDGASVVSGDRDGTVRAWSPASDGPSAPLTRHDGWVNAIGVRAGLVFSLGDDGLVRRTALRDAEAHPALRWGVGFVAATTLVVTPDAAIVAVGGNDGLLRLWNGWTGQARGTVSVGVPITCLALDATGTRLAIGCVDGSVRLRRLIDDAWIGALHGPVSAIRAVLIGAGDSITAGDDAGSVACWSGPGAPRVVLGMHDGAIRGLAGDPAGRLVSAGADGLIRAWHPGAVTRAAEIMRHRGSEEQ